MFQNAFLSDKGHTVKFEIPEDILKKATRCINDFACLSEQWNHCGAIKGLIEGKLLSFNVNQMTVRPCNYRVFFGGGTFCTCPTAIAVFKHKNT
jgi:hypothetical protein